MIFSRVSSRFSEPIADSSLLILNAGLGGMGGLTFWMVASWKYPSSEIGIVTTLISIILPLSTISRFGMEESLKTLIPSLQEQNGRQLLESSFSIAIVASILFAILLGFLVNSEVYSGGLGLSIRISGGGISGDWPLLKYGFVATISLLATSIYPIFTSYLISVKDFVSPLVGSIVMHSSSILSILIIDTVFLAGAHSIGLLIAWTGGAALALTYISWSTYRRSPDQFPRKLRMNWEILRRARSLSFANLLLNVRYPLILAISSAIILGRWGPTAAAEFFILWRASTLGMMVPNSFSVVSLVYRGHDDGKESLSGIVPAALSACAALVFLLMLMLLLPIFGGMFESITPFSIAPWALVIIPAHLMMMNISDWRYTEETSGISLTAFATVVIYLLSLVSLVTNPAEIGWYWLLTISLVGLVGGVHRRLFSRSPMPT